MPFKRNEVQGSNWGGGGGGGGGTIDEPYSKRTISPCCKCQWAIIVVHNMDGVYQTGCLYSK